ncbi:MAG TPA: hypothetical protein VFD71_04895 [Planctomycetota bacterium]|jgi:ElaB/YqjD/DUF883 family membrane-anchored ribosome-binding protein|nr:hypothetical protein [Planctomycetota bacterium]
MNIHDVETSSPTGAATDTEAERPRFPTRADEPEGTEEKEKSHVAESLQQSAAQFRDVVTSFVREKPMTSVIIAAAASAAVGVVVGALALRR